MDPTQPEIIRASGLPTLEKCPSSLVTSAGEPNIGSDATEMGSAFHKVMERRALKPEECDLNQLEVLYEIADEYRVPVSGLAYLARTFKWSPHDQPRVREILVEEEVRQAPIVGHMDLAMVWERLDGKRVLEVVDYKTGDPSFGVEASDSLQVKWYTAKAYDKFPNVDTVRASIAYTQLGDLGWSHHTFFDDEAPDILNKAHGIAQVALAQWDCDVAARTYRRGDHCQWCAGRFHCPQFRRDIRTICENPDASVESENVCDLYQLANGFEGMAKRVKQLCQQYARQRGAQVSTDGGWSLEERNLTKMVNLSLPIVRDALEQAGVEPEMISTVLSLCEDRPVEISTRCQPYRIKKKGARDE